MQATWAKKATEVWNDDWINIKKMKSPVMENFYHLDILQGILLKADLKGIKCFSEWVDNFYLTEHNTCINWKRKGTVIKLVLSNLADVTKDINTGYYTGHSDYSSIAKCGRRTECALQYQ